MIRRSPIFRNGDESLRALERDAVAGDRASGWRYAMALYRDGRLDDLFGALQLAGGEGRVQFYRDLVSAGVRYPEPAFLAGLSSAERALCCVSTFASGHARWINKIEAFGLQHSPHSVELVYADRQGYMSPRLSDRDGNQDQYRGQEGLEKARLEGAVIEASWTELVSSVVRHRDDGFVEHTLFLTPTGYAQRSIYFSGGERSGVNHWDYDVREGFLPTDWTNPVAAMKLGLPFESAVHDLEIKVQRLLDGLGRQVGLASPQEHVPAGLVADVSRRWIDSKPKALFERHSPCGAHNAAAAMCLVVIPAVSGEPPVTIGITDNSREIGPRTRRVNPSHFWPELAPWSPVDDESRRHNKNLDRRLTTWAATDAPDRIRVIHGNVALAWSEWNQSVYEQIRDMGRARNEQERASR